ncbi:hypothetical protein [uncultured Clostridium sp.]|uniref:glycan biosynthesis hexose transferase WsfD n=1 Tax=uncultured Clostridium sp. TaxID=59620 RepID=UPI00261092A3|nr:hypothetical protein [uncultured Clostridium sp.]
MVKKIYSIGEKINFPILTVILAAIIGVNILFVKPIVGMANNGDFFRIMVSNNLYYLRQGPDHQPIYFNYFQPTYGVSNFYNGNPKMIVSTQSLLIKPAMFLERIITGNTSTFDLRYLAFILLCFQLLATYFIMKVFCSYLRSPISKAIISFFYLFVFMDIGYIAYFNSFFGEAVNIPFFLLSVGFLLYMIRFNKITWYNILIFAGTSIVFFGAKQQLAPVGAMLAILLFRIMYYKRSMEVKIVSIALVVIMCASGLYFYAAIKGDFQYINKYHALNRGILLNEKNPDKILSDMGISEQYSLLENTNYFSPITQIDLNNRELVKKYCSQYGVGGILKFYITHPSVMFKMAELGFREGYDIRPNELGNYMVSTGKPPVAKSYFWGGWSYIKAHFLPKSLIASLIYIGIFLYFSVKRYIKGNDDIKLTEEVYYYVLIVGVSQIAISIIGAGDADLAKHEFMYNMAFDFLFLVCIKNLLMSLERRKVIK